jgi:quercetin 2,3-dioxygenase
MSSDAILETFFLGLQPWKTKDPFIFCVYHQDDYPMGNDELGPKVSLSDRRLGQDFQKKDGFRMYHGRRVAGFPKHPHRGFETVTITRRGYVDHSDSLGSTSRYGFGDLQWMTAGEGIQHAEMFPLLERTAPNPLELFQIWINLPARDKLVAPHIKMHWAEEIPKLRSLDSRGNALEIDLYAGRYDGVEALAPAPSSWAAHPDAGVSILHVTLDGGARWTLPASAAGLNRMVYYYAGDSLTLEGHPLTGSKGVALQSDHAATIENGPSKSALLLLEGRPVGEPVVSYGPFVMNTEGEIRAAYEDYHETEFGGRPWERSDPVHPADKGRFAINLDGSVVTKSDRPV